ncbi:TetR/AcrR family transcriptional regulator [Spiractinospora alimapuensis]|nr:TetR/AcrR family transcriptional regulator [Spiractinospora alimapuensis]
MSDQETEQRMLRSAMAMVHENGLTVSLDHISFEDVIRVAGVSRSAVYRRWPHKESFFRELVKELARGDTPDIGAMNPAATDAVRRTILDHLDWLRTPDGRVSLIGEILRNGARDEFGTFLGSPQWRTYIALHATFLSLPAGDFREEVRGALGQSQRRLIDGVATFHAAVMDIVGVRLRPETGATYTTLAELGTALMRGLVVMAASTPHIGTDRVDAAPFGARRTAEWSNPGLGLAALATSLLEADPEVTFDEEHLAHTRKRLAVGTGPFW